MTNLTLRRLTMLGAMFPDIPAIARQFAEIRPFGGARVIVADPNWKFQDWSENGDKRKTPGHHYECRPLEWIMALPVEALAAKDCLLVLWATNPMLREAIQTIDAWGFTYKTAGTWVKRTTHGKVAYGMGRRLRSSNEPFLIATRGAPPVAEAFRSAVVTGASDDDPIASLGLTIEAQAREHSRKPDEVFEMARAMVPEGPAVELFSRQRRPGWTVWGDEVDKFSEAG